VIHNGCKEKSEESNEEGKEVIPYSSTPTR
jgi:hypothetical protein